MGIFPNLRRKTAGTEDQGRGYEISPVAGDARLVVEPYHVPGAENAIYEVYAQRNSQRINLTSVTVTLGGRKILSGDIIEVPKGRHEIVVEASGSDGSKYTGQFVVEE